MLEIAPVRSAQEWAQVREICCETGDAGKPVAKERRPFFAEYWIGPYELLLPDWTLVARSEGRVIGYLTGCPSSLPFYARRFFLHRLPLYAAVLEGRWGRSEDTRRFLHPGEGIRRSMPFRFGARLYGHVIRRYPAHLHVNVRQGSRESGVGGKLVEAYVQKLTAAGVRGLHLFCGKNPVPFYLKVGFEQLTCLDFGKGPVYIMVRTW